MDAAQELEARVAGFFNSASARAWVIAEGTRQAGETEPLLFKTACRVLAKKGITFDQLAAQAS